MGDPKAAHFPQQTWELREMCLEGCFAPDKGSSVTYGQNVQVNVSCNLKRASGMAGCAFRFLVSFGLLATSSGAAKSILQAGSQVALAERSNDLAWNRMLPAASFTNVTAKGKTKMFEFSGVAAIGNKLIVVDNETGKLENNSAGIQDRFNEALFEVTFSEAGELKLQRAWSEAFAKAPSFDDLEGITARDRFVYLMGSHSTDKEGAHRPERHL
ncbi:MAG: hypothetical protein ACK4UN_12895, partial [Limisphaerales bacterium]